MQREFWGSAKLGGVYQIRNDRSGKVYIGSTACFKRRASEHRSDLVRQRHSNSYLQAAWNKWGPDAFTFSVLRVVSDYSERLKAEQGYLDARIRAGLWERTYNLQKRVEQGERSCPSYTPEKTSRKRSASQRAAWAQLTREERRERVRRSGAGNKGRVISDAQRMATSRAMRGRKASPETRRRMSEAHRGKVLSPAARAKLSAAMREAGAKPPGRAWTEAERRAQAELMRTLMSGKPSKRRIPVVQLTLDGERVATFASIQEAERLTGILSIGRCIRGQRYTAGGFKWKRATELCSEKEQEK